MNNKTNIMNRILYVFLASALLVLGGCSSDNDDEGEKKSNVVFTPVDATPDWAVDWTWNDPAPDWEDPAPTKFECSMNMLVELSSLLVPYSTDDDLLAVFIGDECRGVSRRNVINGGEVLFLVHVKGASEEAGQPMTMYYYSAGARQLFINDFALSSFEPDNLMDRNDKDYTLWLSPAEMSTKYPHFTEMMVSMPDDVPFTITADDMMAIFVGDECRGLCRLAPNKEAYDGWRGVIYTRSDGEQGQLRYYSAEKQGVYILADGFTLNNGLQYINVTF